jgi:hypothetical protein
MEERRGGPRGGGGGAGAPAPPRAADAAAPRPADELIQAKARIAELERLVGRQQADLHFFREALRLWDATMPSDVALASTRSSKK